MCVLLPKTRRGATRAYTHHQNIKLDHKARSNLRENTRICGLCSKTRRRCHHAAGVLNSFHQEGHPPYMHAACAHLPNLIPVHLKIYILGSLIPFARNQRQLVCSKFRNAYSVYIGLAHEAHLESANGVGKVGV